MYFLCVYVVKISRRFSQNSMENCVFMETRILTDNADLHRLFVFLNTDLLILKLIQHLIYVTLQTLRYFSIFYVPMWLKTYSLEKPSLTNYLQQTSSFWYINAVYHYVYYKSHVFYLDRETNQIVYLLVP